MSTSFDDLADFIALSRFRGLALSPDGAQLIATIGELNEKRTTWVDALWRIPLTADAAPIRLTRGEEGDSLLGFSASGDIFFSSKRAKGDDAQPQLHMLPAAGGEAVVVAERHGGFSNLRADRSGKTIMVSSAAVIGARDAEHESEIIKARKEQKVTGILHDGFPVRDWDHDIAPTRTQIFTASAAGLADEKLEFTKLTDFARDEHLGSFDLDDSGSVIIASVSRPLRGIAAEHVLVRIDPDTGAATDVAADDAWRYSGVAVSPDGRTAVTWRSSRASDETPLTQRLVAIDLASGQPRVLGGDFDDFPGEAVFSGDGCWVLSSVDHQGAGGVWAFPIDGGEPKRLSDERLSFSQLQVGRSWPENGGPGILALADAVDRAPAPVSLEPSGETRLLPSPLTAVEVPGRLEEVVTTAEDGTRIRAWLCLPADASTDAPAPLAMLIHGGPWGSWNAWTWRWNPWAFVARGYAVLLPDPAISTGYGQHMIDRGWRRIGDTPYDDLIRLCDAAVEREDIDRDRQAALGGSYGGYMANWIAGRTGDRFRCIVTHASLYDMESFRATTDAGDHWRAHLTDVHNAANSPHLNVAAITAPMLVIHGDKDYRVPIGQGLQLWSDLLHAQQAERAQNRNRFLYFPDENHWILSPGNSKLWYETVLGFLDEHVLGRDPVRPDHV